MEQTQRELSSTFNNCDDNKRQKIQVATFETNCLSRDNVRCFEDLADEVLYEIFEFLDFYHVYQAFFNLNRQFDNLIMYSTLPIKIHISSLSKSAFERYNTDIIIPNIHRINSLRISNIFIYDLVSSPFNMLSELVQLEKLSLDNIESKYLEQLLFQIIVLPALSSLIIISVDDVENRTIIYRQIFRLPALKYCKVSLPVEWSTRGLLLPFTTNEYSSIEHLIIEDLISLDELDSLLSYVPQLHRLSIQSVDEVRWNRTAVSSFVLNHLTHISLQLNDIPFDAFEELVVDLFPALQVLRISIKHNSDTAFKDNNRWEQLISTHMPNLRVFDFRHEDWSRNITTNNNNNQFMTPFWIERQWSFAHQSIYGKTIFYSTNPYRRKQYTLYKQSTELLHMNYNKTNLNSVHRVNIQRGRELLLCMNYFPNAIELTLEDGFSTTRDSIGTILNRIIPLKQLTKSVFECHHFSFIKMIDLLSFTPNIHTLIFESMLFNRNDYTSIEQSENFRSVSNTNIITDVTFKEKCTVEKLRLLVALCPRLQHLTIQTFMKDLEPTARFFLERTNQSTSHLSSLCFLRASNKCYEKLKTLINSEALVNDYMLKLVDTKLYLWW